MTAIILAAGTNKGFRFPKQLLKVDDETLLDRQIRQLSSVETRLVMSHREELNHRNAFRITPASRRWKCDTLLSSRYLWSRGITIILHGDVYFTDLAMQHILHCDGKPVTFFWNGGIEGTEAYALVFDGTQHQSVAETATELVNHCASVNAPHNEAGFMHLWGYFKEKQLSHQAVVLADGTRDFDSRQKYHEWICGRRSAKTPCVT